MMQPLMFAGIVDQRGGAARSPRLFDRRPTGTVLIGIEGMSAALKLLFSHGFERGLLIEGIEGRGE